MLKKIRRTHKESHGTYGSPRIHAELTLGLGLPVNLKRVARLMREAGLQGLYRRRRHGCTARDPEAVPSADLGHGHNPPQCACAPRWTPIPGSSSITFETLHTGPDQHYCTPHRKCPAFGGNLMSADAGVYGSVTRLEGDSPATSTCSD